MNEQKRSPGGVNRVMVATDRSETAARAVEWARSLAELHGAELHLVQVVVPTHPAPTEYGAAEATRARVAADELQVEANRLADERGRAHVVIDDDPAMAIVNGGKDVYYAFGPASNENGKSLIRQRWNDATQTWTKTTVSGTPGTGRINVLWAAR